MGVGTIPLISSVISFIFAVTVLDQYFARRKPFQIVWAIGLFIYCISCVTEFWVETYGLNDLVYRLWYFFGAICVAAYLGQGTIYLLASRRAAHIIMVILLLASIYAASKIFTISIDLTHMTTLSATAMTSDVRLLAPFFNVYGTIALVGGALYGAWIFWRRRILPHRVLSNTLIAVGALLPAIGGSWLRFGAVHVPYYTLELVGIVLIFAGFLRTREVFGFYRFPLIHGFSRVAEANPSYPDKLTGLQKED